MFSVLSILIERKQVRGQARLPANDEFTLQSADGRAWVGTMSDLSLGGARASIHAKQQALPHTLSMISWCESRQQNVVIPCSLLYHEPHTGSVRFQFERNNADNWDDIIAFTLGDSRRWKSFQRRRTRPHFVLVWSPSCAQRQHQTGTSTFRYAGNQPVAAAGNQQGTKK